MEVGRCPSSRTPAGCGRDEQGTPCIKSNKMTVVGWSAGGTCTGSVEEQDSLGSSPWHDSPETSPLIWVWLPPWLGLFFSHSSGYWTYWPGLGQELKGIQFHPNKGITDSALLNKAWGYWRGLSK